MNYDSKRFEYIELSYNHNNLKTAHTYILVLSSQQLAFFV